MGATGGKLPEGALTGMLSSGTMAPVLSFYGKCREAYRRHGKLTGAAAYISMAAVYARFFFNSTMFDTLIKDMRVVDILSFSAFGVLGISAGLAAVFGPDRRQSVLQLLVLMSAAASYAFTHNTDMMMLLTAAVAMRDRDPRPFLISSLVIGWGMMLSAYWASMNGYIPYLVYETKGSSLKMAAHAFGIIFSTDFSAHILFMVMAYCAIRGFRMGAAEYMLQWLLVWFCWRYTGALTAVACMMLFLVLYAGLRALAYLRKGGGRVPAWTAALHPACAIASLIAVRLYDGVVPTGALYTTVEGKNQSFLGRLYMSRRAFEEYPLKLFGQEVAERGGGRVPDTSQAYFFLDISYVRILVIYGLALFIIYLTLMALASYRCARCGEGVFAIALAVTALDAIVEHHAIDISYNVFIILAFCRIGGNGPSGNKISFRRLIGTGRCRGEKNGCDDRAA